MLHMFSIGAYLKWIQLIDGQLMLFLTLTLCCHEIVLKIQCLPPFLILCLLFFHLVSILIALLVANSTLNIDSIISCFSCVFNVFGTICSEHSLMILRVFVLFVVFRFHLIRDSSHRLLISIILNRFNCFSSELILSMSDFQSF